MASTIVLTFSNSLNSSIEIGDTLYYCTVTNGITDSPTEVGAVSAFTDKTVTSSMDTSLSTTGLADKFYFFSKNNKANLSSLVGYYAEVEMKNASSGDIELFQVGSEISESSKS